MEEPPHLSNPPLPYPAVRILEGCLSAGAASTANDNILLSNEYGKRDSVLEIQKALLAHGYSDVEFREVTLQDRERVLDGIRSEAESRGGKLVVVNLCDGTETDGYPGLSIVSELERLRLAYTGSDSYFYLATTSKPVLKRMLQEHSVPTSPFVEISPGVSDAELQEAILSLSRQVGFPMIVKPSVSYASLSITDRSVVHNAAECATQCRRVHTETGEGVFVERFLAGREFTALCTGDATQGVNVYTVAERAFDPSLNKYRRILAFDRYWDGFDLNGSRPDASKSTHTPMYVYRSAPEGWQTSLAEVARNAYLACGGSGYGRVDMRTTQDDTCEGVQVLEVNANCGMSFDAVTSTCGAHLELHKEPPAAPRVAATSSSNITGSDPSSTFRPSNRTPKPPRAPRAPSPHITPRPQTPITVSSSDSDGDDPKVVEIVRGVDGAVGCVAGRRDVGARIDLTKDELSVETAEKTTTAHQIGLSAAKGCSGHVAQVEIRIVGAAKRGTPAEEFGIVGAANRGLLGGRDSPVVSSSRQRPLVDYGDVEYTVDTLDGWEVRQGGNPVSVQASRESPAGDVDQFDRHRYRGPRDRGSNMEGQLPRSSIGTLIPTQDNSSGSGLNAAVEVGLGPSGRSQFEQSSGTESSGLRRQHSKSDWRFQTEIFEQDATRVVSWSNVGGYDRESTGEGREDRDRGHEMEMRTPTHRVTQQFREDTQSITATVMKMAIERNRQSGRSSQNTTFVASPPVLPFQPPQSEEMRISPLKPEIKGKVTQGLLDRSMGDSHFYNDKGLPPRLPLPPPLPNVNVLSEGEPVGDTRTTPQSPERVAYRDQGDRRWKNMGDGIEVEIEGAEEPAITGSTIPGKKVPQLMSFGPAPDEEYAAFGFTRVNTHGSVAQGQNHVDYIHFDDFDIQEELVPSRLKSSRSVAEEHQRWKQWEEPQSEGGRETNGLYRRDQISLDHCAQPVRMEPYPAGSRDYYVTSSSDRPGRSISYVSDQRLETVEHQNGFGFDRSHRDEENFAEFETRTFIEQHPIERPGSTSDFYTIEIDTEATQGSSWREESLLRSQEYLIPESSPSRLSAPASSAQHEVRGLSIGSSPSTRNLQSSQTERHSFQRTETGAATAFTHAEALERAAPPSIEPAAPPASGLSRWNMDRNVNAEEHPVLAQEAQCEVNTEKAILAGGAHTEDLLTLLQGEEVVAHPVVVVVEVVRVQCRGGQLIEAERVRTRVKNEVIAWTIEISKSR
ncbi:hypothetical protein HDU93_007676 [Gonapodya sp. JEL0774]|nr:hypothetical protein HDU93_007676 [Gonapodya sp. JEL0774]